MTRPQLDTLISTIAVGVLVYIMYQAGIETGHAQQMHTDSLTVQSSDDSARVWRERWQHQLGVNRMLAWNALHPAAWPPVPPEHRHRGLPVVDTE